MPLTPSTPKRHRAKATARMLRGSSPPPTPPPPTPTTVTKTVTVTKSSGKRVRTKTLTTTSTTLEPVSSSDEEAFSDISSPSPFIRNVPLPPSPSLRAHHVVGGLASPPALVLRSSPAGDRPATSLNSVNAPGISVPAKQGPAAPAKDAHPVNAQRPLVTSQSIAPTVRPTSSAPGPQQNRGAVAGSSAAQILRQSASNAAFLASAPSSVLTAFNAYRIVKVYVAPRPEDIPFIPGDITLWILSGGGGGGIYKTKEEIDDICKKCNWKVFQTRRGFHKALAVYARAWESGSVFIEPNDDGPFATLPYFEYQIIDSGEPLDGIVPEPADIVRPIKEGRYYYVVLIGEEVGIFGSWHEAGLRTQALEKSWCIKFEQWAYAFARYERAFNAHELKATPRRGGPFDPAIAPELRIVTKARVAKD